MRDKNNTGKFILALGIIGILLLVFFFWMSSGLESYSFTGMTMGTFYTIQVVAPDIDKTEMLGLKVHVDNLLQEVNNAMSTYIKESDLSRFNVHASSEPFEVRPDVVMLVSFAIDLAQRSGGAYDPTVGRLVNLWGFGIDKAEDTLPSSSEISEAMALVGYRSLEVESPTTLRKKIPGLNVDLSSIAKGYGVDRVLSEIKNLGYTNVLVEIGGEIAVSGNNARGQQWTISIEAPIIGTGSSGEQYGIFRLQDKAVATSGDYRNYREQGTSVFTHVIDPRTGWPVSNNVASVSVIASDCMTADALATALMVLGPDEGLMLLKEYKGTEAVILVRNGSHGYTDHRSPGFDLYVGKP